ncbi:hypothetical protein ID866_9261 [Astraeus odoratus]|nr:hypothetical protein ID866_9261 [Astraeus odoratus]
MPGSTSAALSVSDQMQHVQSAEDGKQHVQGGSCEIIAGKSESICKIDVATLVSGIYRDRDDLQRKLDGAKMALNDLSRMNANCVQVLKVFKILADTVGGPLSNLNPVAQTAVGLLTKAAQVIIDQDNRDDSVSALLPKIQEVFEFLMAEDTLAHINLDTKACILVQLGQVMNNCAEFVTRYSERRNIATRLGKYFLLDTESDIDGFNQRMDVLMQRYRDRALQSTHVTVSRLWEDFKIDGMAYAAGVGLIKTKACLDGTRLDILADIMAWIDDSDANAPRIFWLNGQAGKGKSAIAHTIAMWFKNVGKLGSCFCFARDRQAEHLEQKLFATIAHDMAIHDPLLRRAVAAAVAADDSLKTTLDVVQQWENLILEPVSSVSDVVIGRVVIVIDALDESGSPPSREHILSILGSNVTSLPPSFRILLTSRPLPDIEQALASAPHVRVASLDDIPTNRDIHLYVSKKLGPVRGIGDAEIKQIVDKSDGLFEWARLACEFIQPSMAGETPREQFDDLMNRGSENGRLLDSMYHAILESAIRKRPIALERFRSVMQQIVSALEPLTVQALNAMHSMFPDKKDHYEVDVILRFMGSLLSGVTNQPASGLVRPLHATFYDFLTDASRSGVYFIGGADVHSSLACASLCILQKDLQFNICKLESSYLCNSEVSDMEERIKANIPLHLSYSCQFWAKHLQSTHFSTNLALQVKSILTSERILFWFEVLGLLNALGSAAADLASTARWLQGQKTFDDTAALAKDGVNANVSFKFLVVKDPLHQVL